MIRQPKITVLKDEVETAITQLFEHIIKTDNKNNFISLLANGHKSNQILEGFSPYIIGPGEEGIMDYDRVDFFHFYTQLPFENQYNETNDSNLKEQIIKHSLHLELMIYTHFWEALPILKVLKQLCNLSDKKYDWNIDVPLMGKHTFIREIRDTFKNSNLEIHSVITKGFHSQIRNAFAHSQYSFSSDTIHLGNYDPKEAWQIPSISICDWEDRFLYTTLLFSSIVKALNTYKDSLSEDLFTIQVPETNNSETLISRKVRYVKNQNRFIWNINNSENSSNSLGCAE